MENEEPNLVVPRPFPHEPSEVLERSASLDLTPERALHKESRLGRKKKRATSQETGAHTSCSPTLLSHHSHPIHDPIPLATPQLNSTTHILNRICTLKQAQQKLTHHSAVPHPSTHTPPHVARAQANGGLEAIAVDQKPLKEVNVSRNTTRYKDLISVAVSDESFQKLTFIPRQARKTKNKHSELGPEVTTGTKEPNVMDLLVPGLECEEADWNRTSVIETGLNSEPTVIDSDDIFAFHSFIKSLK